MNKQQSLSTRAESRLWRAGWLGLTLVILVVALAASVATPEWSTVLAAMTQPAQVTAYPVARAPVLDGVVEPLWDGAATTMVALKRGRHGTETAYKAKLRALYTDQDVFFLVQWPDPEPEPVARGEQNKLILHFTVPAPWEGADDLMCLTACHTTFVDEQSRGRYITAETIPPGLTDPLPVGGGWRDGVWTLEWGRPLVSQNPLDVQYGDLCDAYRFFVKVVEGQPDEPDPASDDLVLVFQRAP